jgi:poly-gamma-glutamate capsule biosynthesis protein CapA/YwtB (metallophosphatase superfamily)
LVLNLANNHIRNGKKQGFLDTKEILEKNNIYYVGVGTNPAESHRILQLKYNGKKLCFQGYSYDGSYKR